MTTSQDTLNRLTPSPFPNDTSLHFTTTYETTVLPPSGNRRQLQARLLEADSLLGLGDARSRARAQQMLHSLREVAESEGEAGIEFRVLTRLVEQFGSSRSPHALQWLRDASDLLPFVLPDAHPLRSDEHEELGRHALRLGLIATRFALNGHPALHLALRFYGAALEAGGLVASDALQATTYFWLGNLLENLFLVRGRRRDLRGAWACYSLAQANGALATLTAADDPQMRIRQRILPRLRGEARSRIQAEVESSAATIVWESIQRELNLPEYS